MKETVINAFADKAVLERLFTNGPGELLAVNSKAGYLKAGQDVYMLCSADLGITPIGIAVDDYTAAAAALRLSAGGRFDTADNALVFRGGVLRVQPYPRRAPQENDWFFFYARDCTPRSFSNIISLPRRYIKKKKVKFIFLSKKHERCNGSR